MSACRQTTARPHGKSAIAEERFAVGGGESNEVYAAGLGDPAFT